jgi:LysR family transcriptional regulator, glycine cleavage system transcriptional activator
LLTESSVLPALYLNALRAFEAAARQRSFVAAAHELHVTPSAISQMVKSLEGYLGRSLFVRSRSGVELTADAREAYAQIHGGLLMLAGGLEQLKRPVPSHVVTLSVTTAFAAKWLLPRIGRFRQRHPTLDLRLDVNNRLVDFASEGVDVGVRYGTGRYPKLVATRLMGEDIFPVCNPALSAEIAGRPLDAALLSGLSLIHDSTIDFDPSFPTWRSWLAARGLALPKQGRSLHLNSSPLALQAAMDGLGVALGRGALIADELAGGKLVQAFGEREASHCAYYVVHRPLEPLPAHIQAICGWLLDEAAVQPSAPALHCSTRRIGTLVPSERKPVLTTPAVSRTSMRVPLASTSTRT